jgi:hypothetical protein
LYGPTPSSNRPSTSGVYQFKDFDRGKVRLLLSLDPASLDLENPKLSASVGL